MTVDPESSIAKAIRQLIPLSRISQIQFYEMCDLLTVEELHEGNYLFKRGDMAEQFVYLLHGRVGLRTDAFKVETVRADSESAKFPLAHQLPRKIDALAETNIKYICVPTHMLEDEQPSEYQENRRPMTTEELHENQDWMTLFLKSPVFRSLPPANLQRILMKLEEVTFQQGETIIEQGEQGDFYYLIKGGRCLITRRPSPGAKEVNLAQLKNQDTFGEDALLSGAPRNVTVRAMTEVTLLRLSREDFIQLVKTPSLKHIDLQQAQIELENGALLLDVSSPDEYQHNKMENSVNVPFFSLRMYLKSLNKKQPVIVVCQDGKISEAAAFLLMRNKFTAYVLAGGVQRFIPQQDVAEQAKLALPVAEQEQAANDLSNQTGKIEPEEEEPAAVIETLKQTIAQLEQKCIRLTQERNSLSEKYNLLLNKLKRG